ncbi:MAG: HAD-IB family phosphatase [Polaribacter sp.]|nr:HAD-IB family phosphatase [Polaribacter sp.]MDG1954465.1 HAD-IB family phosphatase [Polaribacter sp.]MDG2074241.1 HAD-IB family phosphatase [Polaribacter sp.]
MQRNYVFDFDSTLTRVEALDILAEITLAKNPNKDAVIQEIIDITNLGIDGEISFTESLEKRIKLLQATKSDLPKLIKELRKKVSLSIERNKEFFEKYSKDIYVISAGFKEFIIPIVAKYNIPANRVYANTFEYDKNDVIVGFDTENPLSKHNGKIECLRNLKLKGEIQVIGDGYSDYVTREAGIAHKFFAYTENVSRDKTTENADFIAPNLDEFLFVNKLPRSISYPKNRIHILLFDDVDSAVAKQFSEEGFSVETISKNSSEQEIIDKLENVHVLGTYSVEITIGMIHASDKLLAIGDFSSAKVNIDSALYKEKGIVVFKLKKSIKKTTKSILNFINSGDTIGAIDFPNIKLPEYKNTHRFLHIHQNKPGVMAEINKILAKSKSNITAQYLSTDTSIGYVMTDIDKAYNPTLIQKLKSVDGTIKFRVLY